MKEKNVLEKAMLGMPDHLKKYYERLKGKVDEEKIIAYLAEIDINEMDEDLEDPETYDWDTEEGFQAIIDDIYAFSNDEAFYKEGLQWALKGWENLYI